MNRLFRFILLGSALFSAGGAFAAIFDSLESVDQLKIIADQRTTKTDRMPAGKPSEPTKDDEAGAPSTDADAKKEN